MPDSTRQGSPPPMPHGCCRPIEYGAEGSECAPPWMSNMVEPNVVIDSEKEEQEADRQTY